MITISNGVLEYTCEVSHICDTLLMDSSYANSDNFDRIIGDDKRLFVVDRIGKVLGGVVGVFGDAYVGMSMYVDIDGVCGFSVSTEDRVIEDALSKIELLDLMINSYIISYVKCEWCELFGGKEVSKYGVENLWKEVNLLFSYKSVKSYDVKGV